MHGKRGRVEMSVVQAAEHWLRNPRESIKAEPSRPQTSHRMGHDAVVPPATWGRNSRQRRRTGDSMAHPTRHRGLLAHSMDPAVVVAGRSTTSRRRLLRAGPANHLTHRLPRHVLQNLRYRHVDPEHEGLRNRIAGALGRHSSGSQHPLPPQRHLPPRMGRQSTLTACAMSGVHHHYKRM